MYKMDHKREEFCHWALWASVGTLSDDVLLLGLLHICNKMQLNLLTQQPRPQHPVCVCFIDGTLKYKTGSTLALRI